MGSKIKVAKRVEALPAYIFSEINNLKQKALDRGMDLVSLAIGDPDQPTPQTLVNEMKRAVEKGENHLYSPYEGIPAFRKAATNWVKRRFNVEIDPNRETIALIGSKEGIAHLPVAFCNPGDNVLCPSPGYPAYPTSILLAGAKPVSMILTYNNKFLPDPNCLEDQLKKLHPKYMILNYPHNPTSAVGSTEVLKDIVTLAKKYQCFIAYDNAYSEVYFDDAQKPISILEIPGAKDIAIEFHTLSKTFNMTGWRIAFAIGEESLVQGLLKVKTNIDSGPFPAVQETAVYALENADILSQEMREVYAKRRAVALRGLDALKLEYLPSVATFYIWINVPNGQPSMEFTKSLIEQEGLVVTPGVGFGPEGEGFFRISLTVDEARIEEGLKRLARYLGK